MGKTKILAIGDIHGNTGLVEYLADKAEKENVDLIIMAGDITFGEDSVKGLVGPFSKLNKRVFLIPGNHESVATIDFLEKVYDNAKNLHGNGLKFNDVGIFGAGTANMGIHQISDQEIFSLLEKSHDKIKDLKKKIMVTHIHPKGSRQEALGFPGSSAVRHAIEKFEPYMAINAHVHETGGIEEKIGKTRVINVSKKEKIFEV